VLREVRAMGKKNPKQVLTVRKPIFITSDMFAAISLSGDDGYVPLDASLCWIVTEGGILNVELTDEVAWKKAVDLVLPKITSGKIEIVGRPSGVGSSEKIDPLHFVGIEVINPFHPNKDFSSDLLCAEPHVLCSFFGDDWTKAGGDKFYQQYMREAAWTHLRLRKSDVLREFPYSKEPSPRSTVIFETGAQGRPSSMHLIKSELQAQADRGEIKLSLGRQAENLALWLRSTYPGAPAAGVRAIKNGIRDEYWRHRSLKK
jgi:hypothetical protein